MKILLAFLLGFFVSSNIWAACKEPFLPSFSERTTTSIKISWKDNNNPILGYQLAHGVKGTNIANAVKSGINLEKFRSVSGLTSGATYSFWIRSICATNDTSKWEGPFAFTTVIANPSRCEMAIDLKDNNCDNGTEDAFLIDVSLPPSAMPWILQSVSIIVGHTWPADLRISLENPVGTSIILSNRNGTVDDNYGLVKNRALNHVCLQATPV
ncbi:MAG: fibronectin type III domain-containing protein [Saprospiraceae bacterium]|nr:fibronectin type III domain-containing protein [Saprospiraceae bacterium]